VSTGAKRRAAVPDAVAVCVIGAGPAGVVVTAELRRRGFDAVLVESGGMRPTQERSALNQGEIVGDPRFESLEFVRARAHGGTAALWGIDVNGVDHGARLAMIEQGVIERVPTSSGQAWPISTPELAGHYDAVLGRLGRRVRAAELAGSGVSADLAVGTYAFMTRADLLNAFGTPTLAHTLLDATVVGFEVNTSRQPATVCAVRLRQGDVTTSMRCDTVVLAAGTVENVRLALLLRDLEVGVSARVGLGVHDHPRVTGIVSFPSRRRPPEDIGRFAQRVGPGDAVQDRLEVSSTASREGAASASFLLFPRPDTSAASKYRERAARALLDHGAKRVRNLSQRSAGRVGDTVTGVLGLTRRARATLLQPSLRQSWDSEWCAWADSVDVATTRTWKVQTFFEQMPDDANRIELSSATDALGVPKARLVWGHPFALAEHDATLKRFERGWAEPGGATVEWSSEVETVTSHHLSGGLALGTDPAMSATDPNALLWGTRNVYAAGSSLFPASGHANPVFTSMALANRVAEHLATITHD
jgi:2-polyprenyl-6-methoxyphenol hydroxylase-like FAD-dependent oxidoreductase